MKTFPCVCQNRLFFDNTHCVQCGREAGFCPACQRMTAMDADPSGARVCGHNDCGAPLIKCRNYEIENVCNGCVRAEEAAEQPLCADCLLTTVIPDLAVEGNREKLMRLEHAKRRVLYTLRLLNLPILAETSEAEGPALQFAFMADGEEPVYTGHDNGLITINIREADDVEREKARVTFGEPQRTLVGHFRHELGHYYWDVLIKGKREPQFRKFFGDERKPAYGDAMKAYYESGPPADWRDRFISAYASMHPWEDFAETFGAYLDMIGILDTARHMTGKELRLTECAKMLAEYSKVGVQANEMNREMGLKDLVPEVFHSVIAEKLCFVHRLVSDLAEQKSGAEETVPATTST